MQRTKTERTGDKMPPILAMVEHRAMVIPRAGVGNSSAAIMLTVTTCKDMKNLPHNEKPMISLL